MADGKWVMHDEDAKRVDLSFKGSAELNINKLPNYGKKEYTDNRSGDAVLLCAHCGSGDLQAGFGGCGEGFGYKSYLCRACGGTTNFVYKDKTGKYI